MTHLRDTIARSRAGMPAALPAVCSAHPDVLRAALLLAEELDRPLIVEATSNQVNQFGGYTGQTPADFVRQIGQIADAAGVDRARLVLGGDHLGPQVWRKGPAPEAMARAEAMVTAYAAAGFTKIHLDCSEGCAGEAAQVSDECAAERSARLAAACLAAAPDPAALSFVIGTEVPPPGGARAEAADHVIAPTNPDAAAATLHAHRAAFSAAGLASAWPQVCALVVQPGVEFSPEAVHHLPPGDGAALRAVLDDWPGIAFEAHSTDYQSPEAYGRLAGMGFAVLKVGPALTFAYRQAIYALDAIADVAGLDTGLDPAQRVPAVMEAEMRAAPGHWQGHYPDDDSPAARLLRHFSYADRIRYYWARPAARAAVARLLAAFDAAALPDPALAQGFAPEVIDRAAALRRAEPHPARALIAASVQMALRPYFID